MSNLDLNPKFTIAYKGKMFQVVTWEGKPGVIFEAAVRSPGVRMLIEMSRDGVKGLLMTKELRREAGGFDYRLPGGKVFDSLEEFNAFKEQNKDFSEVTLSAAKKENNEEAGVVGGTYTLLEISKAGASVEWDLYYYLVEDAEIGHQNLEEHEQGDIETVFLTPPELYEKLLAREVKEGRSANMVWWWLAKNGHISLARE